MDLRHARPEDAAQLLEIYGPACATPTSFEAAAPNLAEMQDRVRQRWPTYPWLVAEEADRLLGYAYASRHRAREAYAWTVESSVYLRPEAQGRGLARALYHRLIDILRRQGYHTVLAGLTLPNPASMRLHQRLGFETVGTYPEVGFKHCHWHDTQWLSLRLTSEAGREIRLLPEIGEGSWGHDPLVTPRLNLCPLGPGDQHDLLGYLSTEGARLQEAFPVIVSQVGTPEQALDFVRRKAIEWQHRQSYSFALRTHQDDWIGLVSIKSLDWELRHADLGYSLGAAWEGQGMMTEAVDAVADFALGPLGLKRLTARIHPHNLGSQRVAERCGFIREGLISNGHRVGDSWQDLVCYARVPARA